MNPVPKFEKYTVSQLFEALESIHKERFPDRVKIIKEEIAKRQGGVYECAKCKNGSYEIGGMRTSGSGIQAIVDIELNSFVTVSCLECGYTELYKESSSTVETLLDFVVS